MPRTPFAAPLIADALPLTMHAQPAQPVTSTAAAGLPLIERAKFFGSPAKAGGRIGPDGHGLSWAVPRDGVLNLGVAPLDKPELARALTNQQTRPIRGLCWSPESKTVLFINDQGGDENFLLCGADVASGALKS